MTEQPVEQELEALERERKLRTQGISNLWAGGDGDDREDIG